MGVGSSNHSCVWIYIAFLHVDPKPGFLSFSLHMNQDREENGTYLENPEPIFQIVWLTQGMLLFSLPVMSNSLRPHGLQHARPPYPSPSPKVCPSSCLLSWWCHPAISSSDALFSFCPQSIPASRTFPMSQLFTSDDQNTWASASASVLPTGIQGWFPLRLTALIFLLSKGTQRSSPIPQFECVNSSALHLLYGPVLTTVQDHWEDHSLDCMDLCWQSNVSAFSTHCLGLS